MIEPEGELPWLDLPYEASESSGLSAFAESLLPWQSQECPEGLDLLDLVAATLVLLQKYTRQEELAVCIHEGGTLHCVHVKEVLTRTFASLKADVQNVRRPQTHPSQVVIGEENLELLETPGLELLICPGKDFIKWWWRQSKFSKKWAVRAQEDLCRLLDRAMSGAKIADLQLISSEEELHIHSFNRTTVTETNLSLLELLAEASQRWPKREAVVCAGRTLSHAELWSMAGAAAQHLGGTVGTIGAVGTVAILLERGISMVVSLLAIWRAGGVCVPLDLKTPRRRVEQILQDAKVHVAITARSVWDLADPWPFACPVVYVEDFQAKGGNEETEIAGVAPTTEDPAYVLFTSGSTGVPKGVSLTHGNLLAYVRWHVQYYQLSHEDRVPHMAGLSFDASMAEIWPTLAVGGCVLPAPDDEIRLLPEALCKWYAEVDATVAFLTTQLAEGILAEPHFPESKLRILFTGGDKLHMGPPDHAPFQLVNIYGPTECTVNVTMCLVPPGSGAPSIGEPVVGMQLYVVDERMQLQPRGIYGELYIGGPQVGAGYLQRPELTAERFVANPFVDSTSLGQEGPTLWPTGPSWPCREGPKDGPSWAAHTLESTTVQPGTAPRLYRTGDVVRWNEGRIDFLGRLDSQVKIRGQRIELGEIESKLLCHKAVRECVVQCRTFPGSHDKYLAAYWTSTSQTPGDEELLQWLRSELPPYMVPTALLRLEALPLNANGKVDRRRLPDPLRSEAQVGSEESMGHLEGKLRDAFAAVLKRPVAEVPLGVSFFALGGHSLSVGQLVNRIRRELKISASITDVYAAASVQQLAAKLAEVKTDTGEMQVGRNGMNESKTENKESGADGSESGKIKSYRASYQQLSLERMASLSAKASSALNLTFCCHVRGPLDLDCLQQAFIAVQMRHDALRTTIREGQCQIREENCLDFSSISVQGKEAPTDFAEWVLNQQYQTFDLVNGPLCRVRVIQESDEAWILHWTLHHVSADLWSYTILLQDLGFAYDQLRSNSWECVKWNSEAPQYRSYALDGEYAEPAHRGCSEWQEASEYWRQKLHPPPPKLALPGALGQRKREEKRESDLSDLNFTGSKVDFELSRDLSDELQKLSMKFGASLHATLLAAWMVLLSRYAEEDAEDVCVGTPFACRTTPESEETVGYFVTPLCIRAQVTGSFDTFLQQVFGEVQNALRFQRVALNEICEELNLEQRHILQAMFVFQTCPEFGHELPSFFMGHEGSELPLGSELQLESMAIGQRHAQFDLCLMMAYSPSGQLIGNFQYSFASYSRPTILRLQSQYQRLLEQIVKEATQNVTQIQFLDAKDLELVRAISPWQEKHGQLPSESLAELVVQRATANPSAFAMIGPEGTCTYGEILRRAELLASYLCQSLEMASTSSASLNLRDLENLLEESILHMDEDKSDNPLIGLMVAPGPWMLAGPLGAWMSGRGYFALDAAHPLERIQQMTQDAAPQCVFTERKNQSLANSLGWPAFFVEDLTLQRLRRREPWPFVAPEARSLLVFTSGSTGRPKGVVLPMRALLAHVLFTSKHFDFKQGQAVLQHTSWTFDAPICEIWPAIVAGVTVVISKRDGSKDFQYISALVDQHRVSHALFVPSLLAEILEQQALPRSLRSLVVVGEACSLSLTRRILEAPLSLNNFYGPSEAGIGATIYEVDKIGKVPPNVQTLPIGRPVPWHQVLLLDPQLRPAVGRAGQIGIMGEGLASGYLNLPQETKTKFIKTPQAIRDVFPTCGPILYLTGDVGRYCQDNLLEFVGRLDNQVKLRGQRIELGEVEETLLSAPAVTEAVAIVHSDRLIGYVSLLQGIEEGEAVRQCVEKTRQRLPRYMWPELVVVKEWPRGRTGKVDRKALPVPTICVQDTVAPRTPLEKKLLAAFCQVLRRDPECTSVHADFFALGGTSLKAAALLSALRAQLPEAAALQFDEVYAAPSASSLAMLLSNTREVMPLGPAPVEGLMPASLGQEHMLVLQELQPNSGAYNSPVLLRLEGHLDRAAFAASIERVIARHDVLRSNLLRDFIDGEAAVVQVTTPTGEFRYDMEFWSPATADNPPVRHRLRPQTIGGRLKDRISSPGQPELQRADSLLSRMDRTGSGMLMLTRSRTRNSAERRPSWSPAWPTYNSPPMRSPRAEAVPLVEMCSTSSLTFGDERRGSAVDTTMSWLMEEVRKPFDLRDDPLIRVILAKVSAEPCVHFLLINMHHSVTDGRSLAIFRHELTTAYNQYKQREAVQLPPLSMQYADFAYWQRQWMAQGRLEKELAYWRVQLQGLPALQVPTDYPRPAILPLDGGQVPFQLPPALANRLRSLARAKGATLFSVLLGIFALVLGRYGGAMDLAIASPVANRNGPAVEPLIGYFVNTVIFRVAMQSGSFEDLLQRLRETVLGAFKNSSVPYAVLLEEAKLDAAAIPAMFVLQDKDELSWSMEGLRVEQVELERTAALFDITCEMQEMPGTSGGLQGFIVYNRHLWNVTRAERFAQAFQALATAVAEQPTAELLSLPVTSTSERTRILEWGGHNKACVSPTPLIKAFQLQILQNPKQIAIISDDTTLTYEEFGARVTALAAALKTKLPKTPGEPIIIGLLLARSVDLAVAIWATLGVGAAYVPIDPEYPAERIKHILDNAQPKLMLCREEKRQFIETAGNEVFCVENWPISSKGKSSKSSIEQIEQAPPLQLAYVIYTSGSTGKPKGVAIDHRAAANMVREQLALMNISNKDRVLQFFKPAFDGAVQEYLSTFCGGASLVLWGEEGFAEALTQHHVTCATLTPSALSVLEPSRLVALKTLAVAAEACPPALVDTWATHGRTLVNAYGPSENTVVSTWAELTQRSLSQSRQSEDFTLDVQGDSPSVGGSFLSSVTPQQHHVPIGRPLMGVQCYVFESTLYKSLQPIGAPGELCLGGDQLAQGYYRDAAKTAERFISNPLNGKRMYKTGDLVMWLPCGQLLYLGRNDEMVKVRGFRIELTEVEAALSLLGAQAVAVGLNVAKDGLWAWVTPASLSPNALRMELQKTLPQYMVPSRITALSSLPLTPNGKIDKQRLIAETCAEAVDSNDEDVSFCAAPETALESKVAAAAAEALGLVKLGVTTDLRTAGMTSLKAVLLSQKLRDMGLTMPLSALYELQTVRAISEHLATQAANDEVSITEEIEQAHHCRLETCRGLRSLGFFLCRFVAWVWISGVVIWPAMLPLSLARAVVAHGAIPAFTCLVLVSYPLYLLTTMLLVVLTKWVVIGQYRAGSLPLNSWAFLRWWMVDRLIIFVNELCFSAFRGGPVWFAYLHALGLRATGYCRIDTRYISEFDLITLGKCCVIAEGAKLRPAVAEAGALHLRGLVFGDSCAVGENAVCTAGCVAGDNVTLQPLSLFSGRTGRTLPDGSVWKGAPLVQSRQQPIRFPPGRLCRDLFGEIFALLLALSLQTLCSMGAYCAFGFLAEVQGFRGADGHVWQWQQQPEGWLFAATWLLFGPPVMASADVLLGLDLASLTDEVGHDLGIGRLEFGFRLAGMVAVSFAVYGWSLTLSSALLGRFIRGSRNQNSWFFQVRRVLLRLTFFRYPAQLSGTWAMSLYLRLLGGHVSLFATVAISEPPLEPRKLQVAEGALLLSHQALGDCEVGKGAIVAGDAVMLPHSHVESRAIVGAMSVAGRPVKSDLQLVGNPGVIMRRGTLNKVPASSWGHRWLRRAVCIFYPLVAPGVLQLLLLITLLPAMYLLTVLLNMFTKNLQGWSSYLALAGSLPVAYIALGWCLCLLAILLKWIVRSRSVRTWRWYASPGSHLMMFSQQLNSMSISVFMSMAFGSPFYNCWLNLMGAKISSDALILTPLVGDHEMLTVGKGASVDKEALLSSTRLLPASKPQDAEFCVCNNPVVIGTGSTVSHASAVVAAETGNFSVLAPLSAVGASARLPAQTLAVGLPPQAFTWSKDENLVRPSARPIPKELRPPILLPAYVSRAIGRMKVHAAANDGLCAPMVTGACGFLGRHLVAALVASGECSRIFCLVRASDTESAQRRVEEALKKVGVASDLIEAVPGDLSQRNFGRSFVEVQRMAGRVTHVFHSAAKVNLTEPFEMMRKDNVDATGHLLEFCSMVRSKPFHHISTMGVLTPDMLDRHGAVRETAPLGDIRCMPLYGTGDQANGYPQSKWLAEMMVFEAARQGLPAYVHRPGLIGGNSKTGASAEDVFFHFLSDVLQLRCLPDMEGNKFNLTPVDWVAKAIVGIALREGSYAIGSVFHPAVPANSISINDLTDVFQLLGYQNLRVMDFVQWREMILADPIRFKSWSFCAALTVEGHGIDSMADCTVGAQAMHEAVGEEVLNFNARVCLEQQIRWCVGQGLLPAPESTADIEV